MVDRTKYPVVKLGLVLRQDANYVTKLEERLYPKLSVKLYGRGVVVDEPTDGALVRMTRHQLALPGQVILSEIWGKKGAIGIVPPEGEGALVTSHFFLFSVEEHLLLTEYMGWLLRADYFGKQLWAEARGTTGYAAVRPKQFLDLEIPLPPLAEQQRIVARIDALAARIDEARRLRAQAVAEVEAMMGAAADNLLEIADYPVIGLDKIVGRHNLRNGISLKTTDSPSAIRCLRLSSMREGRIDCSDTKPIPLNDNDAEPYLVKTGDVFVVRGNGSLHLVGRAGLVEEECRGVVFPDLFIKVPLRDTGILDRFFVKWWDSRHMRNQIENAAKTTSGIWKINQGHIASFSIPVLDIKQQHRIVTYLDDLQAKVDAVKRLQTETQAELDALLPSVLDRAFRGEL